VLCVKTFIMFSVAAGVIVPKLTISVFICALEHFWVISESWSIVVNKTDV
jgi:hypothetical protein